MTPNPTWHQSALDRYNERIAIMHDGNNINPNAPTPPFILEVAWNEAEEEQEAIEITKQ